MSTPIELTSRIARTTRVSFTRLDDEWLAIDEDGGDLFSLNETAGVVWEALNRSQTVGELCEVVGRRFVVERETCETAVLGLVAQLCDLGLAEVVA